MSSAVNAPLCNIRECKQSSNHKILVIWCPRACATPLLRRLCPRPRPHQTSSAPLENWPQPLFSPAQPTPLRISALFGSGAVVLHLLPLDHQLAEGFDEPRTAAWPHQINHDRAKDLLVGAWLAAVLRRWALLGGNRIRREPCTDAVSARARRRRRRLLLLLPLPATRHGLRHAVSDCMGARK